MLNLLRRLMHLDEDDPFDRTTMERLREHEEAMAKNRAAYQTSAESTANLRSAVLLSRLRSQSFAEFEASIKENKNHG